MKNESFIRWQGYTVGQLSFANNLFLTLAIATLGFEMLLLRQKGFSLSHSDAQLFVVSLILILSSTFLGSFAVITRLLDFRTTAQIARCREKENDKETLLHLRQSAKKLSNTTWLLFWLQPGAFCIGIILLTWSVWQAYSSQLFSSNLLAPISITNDLPKVSAEHSENNFDFSPLINLLGIFVSASLIIWQIDRQHKNNFELHRKNNREKLKLEIYTEYRKKISKASDKTGSASNKARLIVTHFNIFVNQISKGLTPLPINDREPDFHETHFAAINSITDLIFVLEEFEIINPNIEIFRTAFSYAGHEMSEAFFPLQQILLDFLPYDVPLQDQARVGTDVIVPKVPSKDDLQKISDVAQPYIDAAMTAGCYVSDLAREAQNIFLGGLFSHLISPRKPIDPKHVVISTSSEEVEKLKKYFFEETEWGINAKRVEEEIKEEVRKEQSNP